MSDEKLTKEKILSLPWVEAPEKRHTKQPGFGSIPFTPADLPNSGFKWTYIPKPEPQSQAPEPVESKPVKTAVSPAVVFALIPHIAYLVGTNYTLLDPSTVGIVEECGNVYLCRFEVVNRPDPVLPIVGLHWPRPKIERGHDWEMWGNLRHAYNTATNALANNTKRWFREDMSQAVNTILQVCSMAPPEYMTEAEYAFVVNHLTAAMKEPEKYT